LWLYVRFDAADPSLQFATRLAVDPRLGRLLPDRAGRLNVLLGAADRVPRPLVVAGSFTAITKDVKLFTRCCS